MRSNYTRGFQPPTAVDEFHRKPSSSTTGTNLPGVTTPRPPLSTPSPLLPEIETNPPSLGDAILTTPSTFDGAAVATTTTVNSHNPVNQTLTNTSSSANQDPPTITTTPPNVSESPRRNIIHRRSHSDPVITDSQEHQMKKPPPSTVSSTTKSKTSPPASQQIPKLKAMVERPRHGCFRFQLNCRCGKNRKGMCTDAVVFLFTMILIFCFFFMIGIITSFQLIASILFP